MPRVVIVEDGAPPPGTTGPNLLIGCLAIFGALTLIALCCGVCAGVGTMFPY